MPWSNRFRRRRKKFLRVSELWTNLQKVDARLVKIVEMRYFAGFHGRRHRARPWHQRTDGSAGTGKGAAATVARTAVAVSSIRIEALNDGLLSCREEEPFADYPERLISETSSRANPLR